MKATFPFVISLILIFPIHSGRAEDGTTLSLAAVTRTVLAENPRIRQARARWEAMKARVPQATAWDDLKISANAKVARLINVPANAFTDQDVMLEQAIPLSGKNRSRARIALAEAAEAFQGFRRQELDVVAKTRSAYFRMANAYGQLELIRQNLVSLKQSAESSRARYEVGTQTQADVLLAETELARLAETQRDTQRVISEAQSELNTLMNRSPFASLGVPAPVAMSAMPPSAPRLRDVTMQSRPELRIAQSRLAAAQARFQLARREWIPDPTLNARAQRYNAAAQAVSELDAGVSFNVPWTNSSKYSAEDREAKSNVESAEREAEQARLEALALVRDQLTRAEALHHHYELFKEKVTPIAKQTVEASRLGYQSNKSSFLDLITAQRSLRDVEAMTLQHLTDYEIALAELEAIVGTDLHLFQTSAVNAATLYEKR